MPTIYCDQNALVSISAAPTEYKQLIGKRILAGSFQLVLSSWHWIEMSRNPDRQGALDLATFADSLDTLWLRDRISLEKAEIAKEFFVWAKIPYDVPAALVSRGEMIADLTRTPVSRTRGLTSREFVAGWQGHPDVTARVVRAQQRNQGAFDWITQRLKTVLEGQHKVDEALVRQFMPHDTPAGLAIDQETKNSFVLQFNLYAGNCPTIHTEVAASEDAWNLLGKLRWQHFIDRMHFIPALPHTNFFLTDDAGLLKRLKRLKAKLKFDTAEPINLTDFNQQFVP